MTESDNAKWHCVATLRTQEPANCLLNDAGDGSMLWYGMYAHHANSARTGGVGSWRYTDEETSGEVLPLPGVFDWSYLPASADGAETVVCCTDGTVRGLCHSRSGTFAAWSVGVDDEMITSCCALGSADSPPSDFVCSAHLGSLTHVSRGSDGVFVPMRKWQGHEFDAWCVAPGCGFVEEGAGGLLVWSGGDDGMLALWDVRAPATEPLTSSLRRRFDAGVVTVVSGRGATTGLSSEHEIIVGSYDENLYVLDRRSLKRPISSVCVGGGAWRCRLAPPPTEESSRDGCRCSRYVVAAMQGGASIVDWDHANASLALVEEEGTLHASDSLPTINGSEGVLVYDAIFLGDDHTIATTSFYNQSIKIWRRANE
jgi:diphthine methyl ester acylhydrolase